VPEATVDEDRFPVARDRMSVGPELRLMQPKRSPLMEEGTNQQFRSVPVATRTSAWSDLLSIAGLPPPLRILFYGDWNAGPA